MAFTKFVTTSADDVYTSTDEGFWLTIYLSAGQPADGLWRNSGMLFRDVNIYKGSEILSAKITFTSFANLATTLCNTRIYGENNSYPDQFTTYANFVTRFLTTEYANWDAMVAWTTDTEYDSPDISNIVREIIGRNDWGYGNTMGFYWKDNGSDIAARRAAYSFDDSSTKCAKLTITYKDPPGIDTIHDYGFRISKEGYDVKTCTDDECVMTSKLNTFKIPTTLQGSTTLFCPKNYVPVTKTIAHNLGYIPAYEAWFKDENGIWRTAVGNPGFDLTTYDIHTQVPSSNIDTANLNINLINRNVTTDRTATIYYIIFLEKANI